MRDRSRPRAAWPRSHRRRLSILPVGRKCGSLRQLERVVLQKLPGILIAGREHRRIGAAREADRLARIIAPIDAGLIHGAKAFRIAIAYDPARFDRKRRRPLSPHQYPDAARPMLGGLDVVGVLPDALGDEP